MQEAELHGWRVSDSQDMSMRGYRVKVRFMDWLAKPPLLVTSGGASVVGWPFSGSGPQGKPPLEFVEGTGVLVTRVAVHPRRALAAAGYDDGRVVLFGLLPGRDTRRPVARCGRWSRDGARMVTRW